MKVFDWTNLIDSLDSTINDRLGEAVVLIPWNKQSGIYTPGEEGPDPSRKMVVTKGCFVTPGASLVGEAGRATGGGGGGFNTQVLEAECWLSIKLNDLGGAIELWRDYDRVFFPMRGWFSISYIEPSATMRPNVHLIRAHDVAWGEGAPYSVVTPKIVGQLYFDSRAKKFYRAGDKTTTGWVMLQ